MKKIVISITNSFDQDRRMLRSAKALRNHGFEVLVIDRTNKINTSRQHDIPTDSISCWTNKGILFYLEFNIRLFYNLIFTPSDILLSVDADTLFANTLASVIKQKMLIIDMHELFTEVPELAEKPIKKTIWRWIEKIGIATSTKRYTVSETIAKQYEDRYGKSFDVIRNVPLLNDDSEQPTKPTKFTLAYVGAINMGRGLEQLLRALYHIEDVDLIIYGKGDIDQDLKSITDSLNLTDRVHFFGWVNPENIHNYLQKAHIGINLLDPSSRSYFLSLANKYFDYIHAGLPIISMNFPEYRALNDQHRTSILIDDLTEQNIIDAIQKLKNQTDLYEDLLANCQSAKMEWNWQSESLRLISVFDG